MYDPEYTESENRFSVVFSPDEDGDYVRKVSDNNRIYYEYLPSRLSAEQRFSPGQRYAPQMVQTSYSLIRKLM